MGRDGMGMRRAVVGCGTPEGLAPNEVRREYVIEREIILDSAPIAMLSSDLRVAPK